MGLRDCRGEGNEDTMTTEAAARDTLTVIIGLGSNIAPRAHYLGQAATHMAALPETRWGASSPVYETPPWGDTNQQPFLNAAALVTSTLSPETLLEHLFRIEHLLGRDRSGSARRWGPRTIDLDILFIEGRVVDRPTLTVPHPRLRERGFALRPLLDLLPNARDPRDGQMLRECLAARDDNAPLVRQADSIHALVEALRP